MTELKNLATESVNPNSQNIDELSTIEMLKIINNEDKKVAFAVEKILPEIGKAVDMITKSLQNGGRLFYLGAGTSGRLGILDASECPPTYGVDYELAQGVIAGGDSAVFKAKEGAEDDLNLAEKDLNARNFCVKDVLVGIAASGRTPYVIGGLKYAKSLGAKTVALSCVENPIIAEFADISLKAVTGAEVVAGSTRMKAGTAQKMTLNMLSTGVMIKLGKVYGNLMIDLKATNKKLEERAVNIVAEVTGKSRNESLAALQEANGSAKLAIFTLMTGLSAEKGKSVLSVKKNLREALKEYE